MNVKMIVLIVLVLGLGYMLGMKNSAKENSDSEGKFVMQESSPSATLAPQVQEGMTNGQTFEEHKKEMDDGTTIMMMGGVYSPQVLYVSPGQIVKVLNHEANPRSLMSDDHKSFSTLMIKSGESGEFEAPATPGTYTYHNSSNMSQQGTLVVEK